MSASRHIVRSGGMMPLFPRNQNEEFVGTADAATRRLAAGTSEAASAVKRGLADAEGAFKTQGYHLSSEIPSTSRKCSSRVISVKPYCWAVEAIHMSFSGIGRPLFRKSSRIRP